MEYQTKHKGILMDNETCQFCDKRGAEWAGPSHQRAQSHYFRCDDCGHVWSVDRSVTNDGAVSKAGEVPEVPATGQPPAQ